MTHTELIEYWVNTADQDFQTLVTTFNIQARYPDYKYKFYKNCTREFTEYHIHQIKDFHEWIKKKINQ